MNLLWGIIFDCSMRGKPFPSPGDYEAGFGIELLAFLERNWLLRADQYVLFYTRGSVVILTGSAFRGFSASDKSTSASAMSKDENL